MMPLSRTLVPEVQRYVLEADDDASLNSHETREVIWNFSIVKDKNQ